MAHFLHLVSNYSNNVLIDIHLINLDRVYLQSGPLGAVCLSLILHMSIYFKKS